MVAFYIYFAFSAIFSIAFLYNKKDNNLFRALLFSIIYGMIIFPLTLGIVVQKIVDLLEKMEDKK